MLRFYVQISTNVTLGITPVTPTLLATTHWVPMIVSVTRDLVEMVSIVQVRILCCKPHRCFSVCFVNYILLSFVHADINECDTGSHTCHANATCNNTLGSYDCLCNKGFDGDGVSCSGKNLCCKAHKVSYVFVT